jgi:Holliday junction resolvase RusA-like endonuclease
MGRMATLTAPLLFDYRSKEARSEWDVEVTVLGDPIPHGVGKNPKTGDRFVPHRQAKHRGDVMDAYYRQAPARGLLPKGEQVAVDYRFYSSRPGYHTGTGRNAGVVKDRYRDARPTGRPDLDNCCKLVTDSLTGVAWSDDDQIVSLTASKHFTDGPARTEIRIRFG